MKLRLFLDEDVHLALAGALRKRGYGARHTVEERRLGMPDKDQLQFAAREGCCSMALWNSPFSPARSEDRRGFPQLWARSCR